ncbi:hypothetical protein C6361_12740 [Plantactinospora sp. BC1]|uniref:hypothetical protein n=1 Tax=Plantactinospora sp. BC1 TaxID=2108470 RepID=UPI000D15C6C7|nr:hypothetical protein [Plantactinospora sp. BC1]AVT30217.1 hypothetical protein C6361_12740 [Plantactinospora sp. BC1]
MAGMLVAGAAWSAKADSPEDTGRQPLAVEAVTAAHASELVPGVITTTPHARYLSLHARVAIEAERRGWSSSHRPDFRRLLRRCEVVLAAASLHHLNRDQEQHQRRAGWRNPHGVNTIAKALDKHGGVHLDQLAQDYSTVAEGFYGTYGGIEATLSLINPGTIPEPGQAADAEALSALDRIVDLADGPAALAEADLAGTADLCLCAVSGAADGTALRRAYFDPRGPDPELAAVHRASAAVLVAALAGQQVDDNVDLLMDRLCCYTADLAGVLASTDHEAHALRWRGALLRNWSVWAWRMIWAKLVAPLKKPGTRKDAADMFVAGLPNIAVRQALRDELPPTMDAGGVLKPAEHILNDQVGRNGGEWSALQLLQLLAVGARRAGELDGLSRNAFLRYDESSMGPGWVRGWIDEHTDQPLPDAARSLTLGLFNRAEKVSRDKMQWTRTGLRMPTRLRVVGDRLRLEGREGDAAASLRLETFASVLHQLGVLERSGDGSLWGPGPYSAEVGA